MSKPFVVYPNQSGDSSDDDLFEEKEDSNIYDKLTQKLDYSSDTSSETKHYTLASSFHSPETQSTSNSTTAKHDYPPQSATTPQSVKTSTQNNTSMNAVTTAQPPSIAVRAIRPRPAIDLKGDSSSLSSSFSSSSRNRNGRPVIEFKSKMSPPLSHPMSAPTHTSSSKVTYNSAGSLPSATQGNAEYNRGNNNIVTNKNSKNNKNNKSNNKNDNDDYDDDYDSNSNASTSGSGSGSGSDSDSSGSDRDDGYHNQGHFSNKRQRTNTPPPPHRTMISPSSSSSPFSSSSQLSTKQTLLTAFVTQYDSTLQSLNTEIQTLYNSKEMFLNKMNELNTKLNEVARLTKSNNEKRVKLRITNRLRKDNISSELDRYDTYVGNMEQMAKTLGAVLFAEAKKEVLKKKGDLEEELEEIERQWAFLGGGDSSDDEE